MSLKKKSFGSEIKRLASERKRRRERNEILIAREYMEKEIVEDGCFCVGEVDDIGRGKPEEAVRRLREYAELRNRILLKIEEALIEAREVIRREVRPKPMNVKQLKLILRKVCAYFDYLPRRSHLLE
ncbi:Hypothetical predicted protein [Paramuricea clavata]|uniref:Uncharacterized protein n=1 Tax=Paramuricea clavata TaxID=317549 RepID=A0A7D9LND5_PARCT|nr:Hypothetical predicted protein [Paramuricea clavata]